jgi:E3 ubiquitin-protein ligase makorin
MSKDTRPLCRYFAQSCCRLGSDCSFRHELPKGGSEATVCQFYLAGSCSYGSKCRFDHVKPKQPAPVKLAVPSTPPPPPPQPTSAARSTAPLSWASVAAAPTAELDQLRLSSSDDAREPPEQAQQPVSAPGRAADPWASLPAEGEREASDETAREERAARLAASACIECNVCLEMVLSKPTPAERRFGLLPSCWHAFCLACIRGWRAAGEEAQRAAAAEHGRTCPVCRVPSFFVAPSAVWPRDEDEKQALLGAYKARLGGVPCRHFDQGRGSCPFGSSCFFSHRLADGSEAASAPLRRMYGAEEGEVRVVELVRMAAFLES